MERLLLCSCLFVSALGRRKIRQAEMLSGSPEVSLASLGQQAARTTWTYVNPGDIFNATQDILDGGKVAISGAHNTTQENLDAYSKKLPFLRAVYDNVDASATGATSALNEKGVEAQEMLEAALNNQTRQAELLNLKQEACAAAEAARSYDFTRWGNVSSFNCDFSSSASECASEVAAFKAKAGDMSAALASEVVEHLADYNLKRASCSEATAAHSAQVSETDLVENRFRSSVADANNDDAKNLALHCRVGFTVHRLCSEHAAWDTLKTAAQGTGNENSHTDRKSEWNVLHLSWCLTQKFPADAGDAALNACLEEVDYDAQVGTLEFYAELAEAAVEGLSCGAHQRDFISWVMPSDLTQITAALRDQIATSTEVDSVTDGGFPRCASDARSDTPFKVWLTANEESAQSSIGERLATMPAVDA